ncbi:DUF1289 domain-containing protein [Azospirillum halopraeferens]|uniref:DUF1289 domain-containing protein n=1 Tax=Azospirillum halopraeferens TaxID=34010 RepID=UPI00040D8F0A|nr:DUF1289 domain-containing protein [Azospirillum halopraeferens]
MSVDEDYVKSPCVRVCTLDERGVCIGCRRTIDEIRAWGGMDAAARRALVRDLEGRRPAGARPWFTRRG